MITVPSTLPRGILHLILVTLLLGLTASSLDAQEGAAEAPGRPTADPADVATIDAIMAAVYEVISGPAGEVRDWNRFRSLFVEGARLMPTGRDSTGVGRLAVWSPQDFIDRVGPFFEQSGFFEHEVGRVSERYGNVVHLMSAYESRRNADDPEPFVRGVNSFQLWYDGTRWWVVTIMWEDERSAGAIPDRYLGYRDHTLH